MSGLMPRNTIRPKPLASDTAAGVNSARSDQRPPFNGRSTISLAVMVSEISGDSNCSTGVSPVT